jgi:hypothetical protein
MVQKRASQILKIRGPDDDQFCLPNKIKKKKVFQQIYQEIGVKPFCCPIGTEGGCCSAAYDLNHDLAGGWTICVAGTGLLCFFYITFMITYNDPTSVLFFSLHWQALSNFQPRLFFSLYFQIKVYM